MSGVPGTHDSSLITHESFLTVARVVRAHGTAGELACEVVTEFPQRFGRTRRVFLAPPGGDPAAPRQHAVQRARLAPRGQGTQLLLKVEGVDDRDTAEALRGALVQVPESEAWKLPRGRFYWHQIIGLRVTTRDGRDLGTVKEILETGANDVYVIQTERGELLVPAVKQVVKEIAPERGVMIVELLPGMEES
jgi:16S rRNA processing protein RimM